MVHREPDKDRLLEDKDRELQERDIRIEELEGELVTAKRKKKPAGPSMLRAVATWLVVALAGVSICPLLVGLHRLVAYGLSFLLDPDDVKFMNFPTTIFVVIVFALTTWLVIEAYAKAKKKD